MWQEIQETIFQYGVELITMGGNIHPAVGAGIAVVLGILSIYLGFKVKKVKWEESKKKAGEKLGKELGGDQKSADDVQEGIDDFLDD